MLQDSGEMSDAADEDGCVDEMPQSPPRFQSSSSDGETSSNSTDSSDEEDRLPFVVHPNVEPRDLPMDLQSSSDLNDHQPVAVPFSKLMNNLKGKFSENIQERVSATPGEALLNALELSKAHSFPHDVHANLLKFVNSLFPVDILPDTRYKLDDLYVNSCGITYHFYCNVCFGILPTPNRKISSIIKCENCTTEHCSTKLWQNETFFVLVDVPLQMQVLFNKKEGAFESLKSPIELALEHLNCSRDLYGGTAYMNFAKSLDYSKPVRYVSFTKCIDGSPLFKSSGVEVWPMVLQVNELSPKIRMENLLLAGFWFGSTKPKYACFFEVFVPRMKALSDNGCQVKVKDQSVTFHPYLIACCVDSGARGIIQEIHMFNGEMGCSFCLHPGIRDGFGSNARRYCKLDVDPELRSEEEVLEDGKEVLQMLEQGAKKPHVNGVIGISLLVQLPMFNIVDGMIVESLHGKSLGVARQFAKLWFGTEGVDRVITPQYPKGILPEYYIGGDPNVQKINDMISELTPTVETRRLLRKISDLAYFKARDWENFVFYVSVLVLTSILPSAYLNHWILFVQGSYLLQQHELSKEDIDVAERLLNRFADEVESLYKNGDILAKPTKPCKQMTYNVHLLRHAGQNARRWSSDWCISSYAFESANGYIKKMIKSQKGIASQIIRQVSQDLARDILRCSSASTPKSQDFVRTLKKKNVSQCLYVGDCVLLGKIDPLCASEEEQFILTDAGMDPTKFVQCTKVIVNDCVYTTEGYKKSFKRKNCVVRLVDMSFALIRKIIGCQTSGKVLVFTSVVRVHPFHSPGIAHVDPNKRFLYHITLTEQQVQLHPIESIKIVCVVSNVGPLGPTLSPMPNVFTYC